MRIGKSLFLLILLCLPYNIAQAYFQEYPPYNFEDGPAQHLQLETLVDINRNEYRSADADVLAVLEQTADGIDFILKEGNLVLARVKEKEYPYPYAVYWVDLDRNGLKDFIVFNIVFNNYTGLGVDAQLDRVDIFLKKPDDSYAKISFYSLSAGLEDFVDFNQDGKYEIIITDIYNNYKDNYVTYSVYEFKNYKLINIDSKLKGFPKFVWFTNEPNDKDTTQLTGEERAAHVRKKNFSIKNADLPSFTSKNVFSDLQLKEEDFTYKEYKQSVEDLKGILDDYQKGKEISWVQKNIGVPNRCLRLQGFGLYTQRDILRLKLENAKLRSASNEEIAVLEKELNKVEKHIRLFTSQNSWRDQ